MSSVIRMSFLVVPQSFRRFFLLIWKKPLVVGTSMLTCNCWAAVAHLKYRAENLVF